MYMHLSSIVCFKLRAVRRTSALGTRKLALGIGFVALERWKRNENLKRKEKIKTKKAFVPRKTMPVASRKASEQFPPLQGLPSSGLLHGHTLPSHGHEPKRDDRESVCEKIVLENQTKLLAK